MAKFHKECERGIDGLNRIRTCLTKINVEDAVASRAEDEKKVKEIIQKNVGFDEVNKAVVGCMKHWCAKAFVDSLSKMS